jgi:hypothetical protein
MNRPPLEVADIIRAQGNRFLEHQPGWFTWAALQSVPCDYLLPHSSAGRASGPVLPVRLSRHLFPLLPQSALPKMSPRRGNLWVMASVSGPSR